MQPYHLEKVTYKTYSQTAMANALRYQLNAALTYGVLLTTIRQGVLGKSIQKLFI
jgi:hypothetical protein